MIPRRLFDDAATLATHLRAGYRLRHARQKVLVHVGAHKTATSLVQHYARNRRWQLKSSRVGTLDPTKLARLIGWGDLVNQDPEPLRKRVAKELSNPWMRYLLLSHENSLGRPFMTGKTGLYPAAQRGLSGLARALKDFPVTVILSIRPQAEFVESYYLQLVNEGQTSDFAGWSARLNLQELRWQPVADHAAACFGRENLRVIDFRTIEAGQEAYLEHFFRMAAPDLELKPRYDHLHNPGLSKAGLEIALAANPHLTTRGERAALRSFLHKHFSNKTRERPAFFSPESKEALNTALAADYAAALAAGTTPDALLKPPSASR